MDKIIDNIKNFLFSNKKRTLITIIALVIVSFGIGYLVFAENDPYENKIVVLPGDVEKSIVDGTVNNDGNMDTCTGANGQCLDGEDNSLKNKVVRNFDSITYSLEFILRLDEETTKKFETENPTVDGRTVNIAVFIPKSSNAYLTSTSSAGQSSSSQQAGEYIYDIYTVTNNQAIGFNNTIVPEKRQFEFTVNNINFRNKGDFKPIIYMYESTAETDTDVSKENFNPTSDEYKKDKTLIDVDPVTVTGVADYTINLFEGSSTRDDNNNRTFTTNIVLGLDNSTPKGIKGKFIPDSVNLKLEMSSDSAHAGFEIIRIDNTDYKKSGNYSSSFMSGDKKLPYLEDMTSDYSNNGNLSFGDNNTISISNIGNLEKEASYFESGNLNIKIVSSKIYQFKAIRADGNYSDSNITLTATDVNNPSRTNTISIKDNFGKYVGNFSSDINLYDNNGGKMAEKPQKSGLASYNLGAEFYINASMDYSDLSGGEALSDFNNYIKIDSEAIKLTTYKDNDNIYDLKVNDKAKDDATVEFIYGKWTTDYFTVDTNACPNLKITELNKDQLMNLYGGPCINFNEKIEVEDNPGVEHGDLDVILVKTHFKTLNPQSKVNLKLRAIIKPEIDLVNQTFQIVSNSVGKYNDKLYYLSDHIVTSDSTNKDDIDIMKDMNNYKKTVYNLSSGKITDHIVANNAISGNTILVSALKVPAPTVESYYDGDAQDSFDEFPIEWKINTKAIKVIKSPYKKAEVYVYLPKYLIFSDAIMGTTPIFPKEVTSDKPEYKEYLFTFETEKIDEDGNVAFSVFTNREFTTPSKIDQIIYVKSNFYIEDNNNIYSDVSSEADRTSSKTIKLHNYSELLTSGNIIEKYIETSKPYNYTVKAYNNQNISSKVALLYVLPYKGDVASDELGSDYDGKLSVKLSKLPDGYKVYYTDKSSSTILSSEISNVDAGWKIWNDYTVDKSNITAVKIVSDNNIEVNNYFASEEGITFTVTPIGNSLGNEYYNRFTVLTMENDQAKRYFNSNSSTVSVYNRRISGFVFEDSDYDGLYSEAYEKVMADIPVELYKLSTTEIDLNASIVDLISDKDVKVKETTTNSRGRYSFRGLEAGYYYAKYKFDCKKYTVTDKGKQSEALSNSETINSNATMLNDKCDSVSDIIELNSNEKLEKQNINLGLAIRKVFGISLKKYITNVTVNSTIGSTSHDYENENKVKIDLKNPKNTSLRVTYKFELENTKYFPGYVGLISENIPGGMTFDPTLAENDGWAEYSGGLYYTKFQNMLIIPGEKYYFSIVLDLNSDSAGNYINVISGSNLSILGDDNTMIDFSEFQTETGSEIINPDQNQQQNTETGENTNE